MDTDRTLGLRRAKGVTGLLAALGVAGSLAVATVAYAGRPADTEPAPVVETEPADNGSAWPQLDSDDSGSSSRTDATTGGS